ncbi:MAG: hypothetical protein QOH84_4256 [Kribbellaceae bacterium]|jgi:hypothetical protein|nr:hypothetical protein [Kribbellaceae bacterium]
MFSLSRNTLVSLAGLLVGIAGLGIQWIVGVGTLAGQLTPNLTSGDLGTVTGNVVMAIGLAVTFVAGIRSMLTTRRPARNTPRRVAER